MELFNEKLDELKAKLTEDSMEEDVVSIARLQEFMDIIVDYLIRKEGKTIEERLDEFLAAKLGEVQADRYGMGVQQLVPKTVLQIAPLDGAIQEKDYGVTKILGEHHSTLYLRPLNSGNYSSKIDYDGYSVFSKYQGQQSIHTYIKVLNNGYVEAVDATMLSYDGQNFWLTAFENQIIQCVQRTLAVMRQRLEITTECVVKVSLLNVKGLIPRMNPMRGGLLDMHPVEVDELLLPTVRIRTDEQNVALALRPIFDRIWNSVGLRQSFNYDGNGDWVGDQRERG